MSREAMKQALEALELYQSKSSVQMFDDAVKALRQALETEQEPVAWYCNEGLNRGVSLKQESPKWAPLYTAPKQWVGLTDDEVAQAMYRADAIITGPMQFRFAKEIEAKLREKNI